MRIHSPTIIGFAATLFSSVMRLLFWSLRLDVRTTQDANPYASCGAARYIYSVWHDSALIAAFGGKHVRTIALTSRHRDGAFVANVMKNIGVGVVRGSTKHGGRSALRELIQTANEKDVVVTPDGPRGPQREISPGVIFLASKSNRAIVPTAFACERSWKIQGSWTHLEIPKPFSKAFLLAGDPISIPADLDRSQFADYAQLVQERMNGLEADVKELVATKC